jgi:uncharacterized protein
MNKELENKLTKIAEERQVKDDPSHDFQHIKRVLFIAKKIGESENMDLDVIIPAALFHDTVVYMKNSKESKNETEESATVVGDILINIQEYPKEKISKVQTCILECSFTKGLLPSIPESSVLQDADLLESTGAISIIRTFSSGGQMKRQFYNPDDPFRIQTPPNVSDSGLDLFFVRLLKAKSRMHTNYAKKIAERRTKFLTDFIDELKIELSEAGITKD